MTSESAGEPQCAVHFLGTGGWLPSDNRETSCYAVRNGPNMLLFDAGTGLRRLVTEHSIHEGISRIDIALSHFHLDHVIGLSYLDALDPDIERHIWGPGAWLYGEATDTVLGRLLFRPFGSAPFDELFTAAHDLDSGMECVGPHPVRMRAQTAHSDPSVAFRYGDDLAYCTDTAFDPGNVQFAMDVSLLLHEAWVADPVGTRVHSSAAEAARIAREAKVRRLVLIHLDPRLPETSLLDQASRVFADTDLGVDGKRMSLGGRPEPSPVGCTSEIGVVGDRSLS
jgi:ribonuclease BN (tRNA processing enzyme)